MEAKLSRMAQRVLQAGVASSANERAFSGWKHILGDKRTRLARASSGNGATGRDVHIIYVLIYVGVM